MSSSHDVGLIYPARSFMRVVFPDQDRPTNAVRFPHWMVREKLDKTSDEFPYEKVRSSRQKSHFLKRKTSPVS